MRNGSVCGRITVALAAATLLCGLTGCGRLQRRIDRQQRTIERLKTENARLVHAYTFVYSDAAAKEAELSDAQQALAMTEQDYAATIVDLNNLASGYNSVEEELKGMVKNLSNTNARLQRDYQDTLEKLRDQRQTNRELRHALTRSESAAQKMLATLDELTVSLNRLISDGKLSVRSRRGRITVNVPSDGLFKKDGADLTRKGIRIFNQVATALSKIKGRKFQVAGHTDSTLSSQKNYPTNWDLSSARAISVVKYLEKKIDGSQLSAAGFSQYQGVKSTSNRRIEIVLMPNKDELPSLSLFQGQQPPPPEQDMGMY